MNFSAKNQRGLTFISLFIILSVLAFFVLLALKVGPIYMNHSKVTNALSAVESMPEVKSMSKNEIIKSLNKRFGMNYVTKVDDKDVSILKQGNYVKVEIEYERVEKIFGNLSVLVQFYDFFEAGEPE
jgi:Tfp pilus assembly protein PilE